MLDPYKKIKVNGKILMEHRYVIEQHLGRNEVEML